VLAAFAFAVLQTPSGLDQNEATLDSTQPAATQSPVSITQVSVPPAPVPWIPPEGTWIGLARTKAGTVELLMGNATPIIGPGNVVDIFPDGTTLSVSDESEVSLVEADRIVIPRFPAIPPDDALTGELALAPNGRALALVADDGQLWLWQLTSSVEPGSTASVGLPAPVAALRWSPDSTLVGVSFAGGGFGVWDVTTRALVASAPNVDLLAVSRLGTALWTGERLELRDLEGSLIRTWTTPSIDTSRGLPPAEFDPNERLLAVQAVSEGPNGPLDGLWVLSVFGSDQERLVAGNPAATSFVWAGDGAALYYVSNGALSTYPVESIYDITPVEGARTTTGPLAVGDRLRVYDPALVPTGVLTVQDGPELVAHALDPGLLGRFSRPAPNTDSELIALETATTSVVDAVCRVLAREIAPEGKPPISEPRRVLQDDGMTVIETSLPSICVYRPGETLMFEGSSLTTLGGHILFTDGDSVRAVFGVTSKRVLQASALSAERILAIAGLRENLFVRTETGGRGVLYQVPRWSSVLGDPVRRPSDLDADPIAVFVLDAPITEGGLIAAPDDRALAVLAEADGRHVTHLLAYPVKERLSPCNPTGGALCEIARTGGAPLDFSPDGLWLLVKTEDGAALAVSTRGRGVVGLDVTIADGAVWTAS
jgi:hypothetical protein